MSLLRESILGDEKRRMGPYLSLSVIDVDLLLRQVFVLAIYETPELPESVT